MKNVIKKYLKRFLCIFGILFLIIIITEPFLKDLGTIPLKISESLKIRQPETNKQHKVYLLLQKISLFIQNVVQKIDNTTDNIIKKISQNKANTKIYSKKSTKALEEYIDFITLSSNQHDTRESFKNKKIAILNKYSHIFDETTIEFLKDIKLEDTKNTQSNLKFIQNSLVQSLEQNVAHSLKKNYTIISQATYDTIYMVTISTFFAVIFGLPLGVLLTITKTGKILSASSLNFILGTVINIIRSFPFIILIILILPLSSLLIGSMIGPTAAIIPLGIAAIPFIARLFESALEEVDNGLIEATLSMGASKLKVITMMIAEAMPGIINAIIITIIGLIGYSAMAGALGAGGLGDIAIRLGFQGYQTDILLNSVIVIIILVQCIQNIGDEIVAKIRSKR